MGLDNALIYVDNIATAFAEYDPENAETYMANAQAYKPKSAIQSVPCAIRLPRFLPTDAGS